MNAFFFFLQASDSVTLDLLTYADLELLRNRKAGVVSRPRGHQQPSALTAKRYLILIYTVEFDRCVATFSLLLNIILFDNALRCASCSVFWLCQCVTILYFQDTLPFTPALRG